MSDDTADQHVAVPVTLDVYSRWATQAVLLVVKPIYTALYHLTRSLSFAVLWILNLLYRPLAFVVQPVVYLLQFLLSLLAAPVRVLIQLETLYIYLGIAAIIGVTGGLAAGLISGAIDQLRKRDAAAALNNNNRPGRTAKQYREGRRKAKATAASSQISPYGRLSTGRGSGSGSGSASVSDGSVTAARKRGRSGGLLAQTILEEEDSDF